MDGFSGYNQIKMAPEDMDNMTFLTLRGIFYYKMMSFWIKKYWGNISSGYGGIVP